MYMYIPSSGGSQSVMIQGVVIKLILLSDMYYMYMHKLYVLVQYIHAPQLCNYIVHL